MKETLWSVQMENAWKQRLSRIVVVLEKWRMSIGQQGPRSETIREPHLDRGSTEDSDDEVKLLIRGGQHVLINSSARSLKVDQRQNAQGRNERGRHYE